MEQMKKAYHQCTNLQCSISWSTR
ncbi:MULTISPECIES: hypothetical protein [Pectobacteriaceae]